MDGEMTMGDVLPPYKAFFEPVLEALKQLGGSGRPPEVKDVLIQALNLSEEALSQTNEKSGETKFSNWVDWARFNLAHQGYLDSSTRGVWSLTKKGEAARMTPDLVDEIVRTVKRSLKSKEKLTGTPDPTSKETDEEPLFPSSDYRAEVRTILADLSPTGFENFCQRVLRESGFEKVTVTGRSGDGGIDGHGVLPINAFVSFTVMFQCKRYKGAVGSSEVRNFRGALEGRADKAIIMTTGTFTQAAKEEASREGATPIELVTGEQLLEMMEELELGLRPIKAFEVIDGFFGEFK